jgi:hypothetical protein
MRRIRGIYFLPTISDDDPPGMTKKKFERSLDPIF